MTTQSDVLLAGVNADDYLVGPAVLLLQAVTNYDTSADTAGGMPRYIDDVITISTAAALTANGWYYLGYTENIAMARSRTTVQHDADQEARVKTVHDTWENTITLAALETTLADLQDYLQGHASDPSAVAGAPTGQSYVRIGNPTDIDYRRVAILQVDDTNHLWAYVYRKGNVRTTGGPTWSRTGRVEWPLEIDFFSDTRVTDVNDRVLRIFRTTASIA